MYIYNFRTGVLFVLLLLQLQVHAITVEERHALAQKILPIIQTLLLSHSKVTHSVASEQEASAFLSRATFGATQDDINHLMTLGSYDIWFEEQFTAAPTYHIAWAEQNLKGINGVGDLKDNPKDWKRYSDALSYMQRDAWWDIAVHSKDQLRQRVALALSEIFVISKEGSLINAPDGRMAYYDVLVKNALGNFETLLQEVTYHPSMGKYLSYLGNAKADPAKGSHPDENYAREVMQLFSIGLFQLNLDGTLKRDAQGKALPTYTQDDIKEMAKVFTGLTDDNGFFFAAEGGSTHTTRIEPMIYNNAYHDTSKKHILGNIIPAGGSTKDDINAALHILFMHQNTAPFIARRLIQRLVTSNPSPAYIRRVAQVFNRNEQGIRGDIKSVIKAILLDNEALHGAEYRPTTFGKFREPLLFYTHLFRAFGAQNSLNTLYQEEVPLYQYRSFNFHGNGYTRQEAPLEALSVFNYFTPDDAPYSLKKESLVAPELELYGTDGIHQVLMGLINKDGFIYDTYQLTAELQLETEKLFIKNKQYNALLEHLNILLLGGTMSTITKNAIVTYMQHHAALDDETLARYVISLVMSSPDYALQQ